MTAFEIYLGREMKPSESIIEREWYCKTHLSKETQKWREKVIKENQPKQEPKQLTLWT